jgi:hypothetical protein
VRGLILHVYLRRFVYFSLIDPAYTSISATPRKIKRRGSRGAVGPNCKRDAFQSLSQICAVGTLKRAGTRHSLRSRTEERELATVWGLLKEISTPVSKNCTLLELSESYSRRTGCCGPADQKLGTSGSAGTPGRQLPGSTQPLALPSTCALPKSFICFHCVYQLLNFTRIAFC